MTHEKEKKENTSYHSFFGLNYKTNSQKEHRSEYIMIALKKKNNMVPFR